MHTISFFRAIIRVRQVVLTKLLLIPVLIFSLLGNGRGSEELVIAPVEVAKNELTLRPKLGKWFYRDKAFTGYTMVYHPNGAIAERMGYYQGKKQGRTQKWFADGTLRRWATYHANRLNGRVRSWWPNGVLSMESNYVDGVAHGVQRKWYPNGQLARQTRLNLGREEGMQQAWLRNGKLYANYEARDGRFFGLKRSNLCYALEDEVVQR